MHKLGSVLAFFFNKVFIFVWVILILVGVPLLGVASTVTDPEAVKTILADADVYTTVPDNILDIIEFDTSEDEEPRDFECESCDPFDQDPNEDKIATQTVREVLEENGLIDADLLIGATKETLDEQFLESQVSAVIDGAYDFISGSNDELEFAISLSERRDTIALQLRSLLTESLAEIPVCTADEYKDGDELDVLDLTCLPAGGDLEAEINKFIDELTAEDGILGETFTQDDLEVSELDLAGAQLAHEALSLLPTIFWLTITGLSFMIVLTAKSIHFGFKEVGLMFGTIGILFLLAFGTLSSAVDVRDMVISDSSDISANQQEAIFNIVEPLAEEIISTVASRIVPISVVMTIVGVASFLFGIYMTRHHVDHLALHRSALDDKDDSKTIDQIYPEASKGRSKPEAKATETPRQTKPVAKKPARKVPKKIQ